MEPWRSSWIHSGCFVRFTFFHAGAAGHFAPQLASFSPMASSGGATEGSTADSLDCQGGDCKSSRSRPAGLRRAVRFGIPHCLLRTGELLALQFKDLELSTETGVVSLYSSKSGLRTGTEEAVAVRDPLVLELLQTLAVSQKFCPGQKLWPHSAQFFRNRFAEHMRFFRIAHLKMKPYSLRRGGQHFYYNKDYLWTLYCSEDAGVPWTSRVSI